MKKLYQLTRKSARAADGLIYMNGQKYAKSTQ